MLEEEVEEGINVCCVIADSLRWDVFVDSQPANILQLGKARKAYSIANSTLPAMHGYLMNYPPIGIGMGLFVHGKGNPETAKYRSWSEFRRWMPTYFREQGYFTIWLSANPVLVRVDRELGGNLRKTFNHWGAEDYCRETDKRETFWMVDRATPQIIRDLDLHVKMNKDKPIFAVILLLDTHTPYHDGEKLHLIDPSQPALNYRNQCNAMKYIDNVFPNFIKIFSQTKRTTEFIFMSDHGENFEGRGWGHNSFRPTLKFGEKLFAIPFVRGRIEDWSLVTIGDPSR